MESPAKEPWYKRAWEVIWEETLKKLWLFALVSFITWLSQRARSMPSAAIHPLEYFFATSTVVFGSLASVLSVAKLASWGTVRARRWRHPASLQLTPHGGKSAIVEIQHHGETATWEARLRILRLADNYPNPDPMLRQCFLRKDGKTFRSLLLKEGDSASIVLATIHWSDFPGSGSGTWVAIQNAEADGGTRVDADAMVELNVTANPPPMRKGAIKKCFQIARVGTSVMGCVDAACS